MNELDPDYKIFQSLIAFDETEQKLGPWRFRSDQIQFDEDIFEEYVDQFNNFFTQKIQSFIEFNFKNEKFQPSDTGNLSQIVQMYNLTPYSISDYEAV